jgi:hypothetical protein
MLAPSGTQNILAEAKDKNTRFCKVVFDRSFVREIVIKKGAVHVDQKEFSARHSAMGGLAVQYV